MMNKSTKIAVGAGIIVAGAAAIVGVKIMKNNKELDESMARKTLERADKIVKELDEVEQKHGEFSPEAIELKYKLCVELGRMPKRYRDKVEKYHKRNA